MSTLEKLEDANQKLPKTQHQELGYVRVLFLAAVDDLRALGLRQHPGKPYVVAQGRMCH